MAQPVRQCTVAMRAVRLSDASWSGTVSMIPRQGMLRVLVPEQRYVPAAGRAAFTGVYDAVVAATMRERRWRPELVRRAAAATPRGGRIVDVGAGTGTLAIALAGARPDAEVVAVDGDPAVLRRARRKRGAERVAWCEGLADALPLADGAADAAIMSLVLHHLDRPGKLAALRSVRRVLRPGGRLLVADWGVPGDPVMRAASRVLAVVDGAAGLDDPLAGRLPALVREAGFADGERFGRLRTGWGSLELLEFHSPTLAAAPPHGPRA
jgi:SAM-dependent methyltransferase